MDFPPEYSIHHNFVLAFLKAAPELKPFWEEYARDEYEFIPTSAMYDLARGVVALVTLQLESPSEDLDDGLKRIFAFLETGMEESEEGPIPNLIRLTMCDWLGRQSVHKSIFALLLNYIGPLVREYLVTAGDQMPFSSSGRKANTESYAKPHTSAVKVAPPSEIQFDSGESLEKLLEVTWSFILFRYGRHYLLSVVCGGPGLYVVDFELNADELSAFRSRGDSSIIELAKRVSYRPSKYMSRRIRIPNDLRIAANKAKANEEGS